MTYAFKKIDKQDFVIASVLFLIGIATRIPFASRMIFAGDSARFAMAMEQYDVAQMRPHAPGYFLYIAIAKFVYLFIHDTRLSLVAVSISSSVLTIVMLYLLTSKMYDRSSGIISALVLLSSSLFWFNSEMPFTYALEGLLSVVFAYSCYKTINDEKNWWIASAVIIGLATGVRQHIIIMFLPLWLYSIRRCSFKQILASFFIFGVTCLTWVIPMITLTGGLKKYFAAVDAQFNTWVLHPAPFLFQIKERGTIFTTFMIYSLGAGLLPILYYFIRTVRISTIMSDIKLQFIILWFLPAVLFFIGVNLFNPGHVVFILPPLFIFLAESVRKLSKDIEEGLKRVLLNTANKFVNSVRKIFLYKAVVLSSVLVIVLINMYMFLFMDTQVSYAAIQKGDSRLAELIRLTKENSTPAKTIIMTFFYNTHAGFYLQDYLVYCPFPLIFSEVEVPLDAQNVYISFHHQTTPKTYWIRTGFKIEPIPIPKGIEKIIFWEDEIVQYYRNTDRPIEEIKSNIDNTKIYLLKVKEEEKIYYDYHYLSVG